VNGTVSPSSSPVCVNNLPATVDGTGSFSISGVPLAVGANDVVVNAALPSGNVSFAKVSLTRQASNNPPVVTISNPTDPFDPTPHININLSDDHGLVLTRPGFASSFGPLKAILNGADVSSSLVLDTSNATSAALHLDITQVLTPGTQILMVSVADTEGASGSGVLTWDFNGPVINSLSPRLGMPPVGATPATSLTINGFGFSSTLNADTVTFKSGPTTTVTAHPTSATASTLHVAIPAGAVDGPVTVTVDQVTSNSIPVDIQTSEIDGDNEYIAVDAAGNMYVSDWFFEGGNDPLGNAVVFKYSPDGLNSSLYLDFGGDADVTGMAFDPTGTMLFLTTVQDWGDPATILKRPIPEALLPDYAPGSCSVTGTICYSSSDCLTGSGFCEFDFAFYDSALWQFDTQHNTEVAETPFAAAGEYSSLSGVAVDANYVYFGAYDVGTVPNYIWNMPILRISRSNGSMLNIHAFQLSAIFFQDLAVSTNGNIYVSYGREAPNVGNWISIFTLNSGGMQIGNYTGTGTEDLAGVAVDCQDHMFVTSHDGLSIYELSSTGSLLALRSTTEPQPYDITIDTNGDVYTTCRKTINGSVVNYLHLSSYRDTACANDIRVQLTGDNTKITSDVNPSGNPTPHDQYTVLDVTFVPHSGGTSFGNPILPTGTLVTWSCVDADDPATDPGVDPVTPNDNQGTWWPGPPSRIGAFMQEGSYTSTGLVLDCASGTTATSVVIVNGSQIPETKIQFHPSRAPGDNFVVTGRIDYQRPTGPVSRSFTSRVMTVWRKVQVETDSMGQNTGPVDFDMSSDPSRYDAFIGDIPDADASLVINAMKQAYIDVSLVGPQAHTDVAFSPHVPYQDPSPTEVAEIQAQGGLGRDVSSCTDSWGVYAQGTYEGGVNEDNDPVIPPEGNEGGLLGITAIPSFSLVEIETIRDVAFSRLGGDNAIPPNSCPVHPYDEMYLIRAITLHELMHDFLGPGEGTTCNGSAGIMENDPEFPYLIGGQLRTIRGWTPVCWSRP
jgi:hypothetical protein